MSDYNELLENAKEAIRASELAPHAAQIEALLRPGIAINTEAAPDDAISVGNSKIGGLPDAPRGFAWPFFRDEPLSFIAQFRLEEIAPFDLDHVLPTSGLLLFFSALRPMGGEIDDSRLHGDIGLIQETRGAWRILCFDGDQNFERVALPTRESGRIYKSQAISSLWNVLSVPDAGAVELNSLLRDEDDDLTDEWDEYLDLWDEFGLGRSGHHSLLGQGRFRQDDVRICAERFASQPRIGTPRKTIHRKAARWRLLIQLSSINDMSWAGDGYGYFYLPEEDLAARRFENAYFGLQR
ncbi:MAG TPA: YwqG family protein [Abditibacterium sp.]